MKVYILFKKKFPTLKKSKEFIVDNIYTDKTGVERKVLKLHKGADTPIRMYGNTTFKSDVQETYYITKSIRGRFKLKTNKVTFVDNKINIHATQAK